MTPCRLLAVLLALTAASACAQDWPGFRGPHRDGIARGAKPPAKWSKDSNLAWRTELPGPGASSPIVVGDRVIVTCYTGYGSHLGDGGDPKKLEHHIVCVSRGNGKVLWKRTIPGPLEKEARRVQLSEHGFATPTPVSDGKSVFAYLGFGGLAALDLDGKVLWKADLGRPTEGAPKATNTVVREGKALTLRWGAAASPLIHDGLVIVNAGEETNAIQAFDKKTGDRIWKRESSNLEGCAISPTIVAGPDGPILVVVLAGEIWAMEPKTGKPLWSIETETRGGMSPTPIADGEMLYAFGGAGDSYGVKLAAPEDGKAASRIAWRGPNVAIGSPILHGGKLHLTTTQGHILVIDAKTGEQVVKKRLEGRTGGIYASPVLAADRLYIVTKKRGVFVYAMDDDFSLVSRNELDDESRFNASPAVVGDAIYIRSDRYLYGIARTPEEPR